MALVSKDPGGQSGAMGVITLEDVIEELIGEEIIDETDVYIDGKSMNTRIFFRLKYSFPRSCHQWPIRSVLSADRLRTANPVFCTKLFGTHASAPCMKMESPLLQLSWLVQHPVIPFTVIRSLSLTKRHTALLQMVVSLLRLPKAQAPAMKLKVF